MGSISREVLSWWLYLVRL